MFTRSLLASKSKPATANRAGLACHALSAFALLFSANVSAAPQVSLAWNASSTATVTGYRLYYGTASGSYGSHTDVGNQLSYTVGGLTAGANYYFAVKAYNAAGTESDYSNEVSATAPAATANRAPTGSVTAPASNVSVTTGTSVSFQGSGTDADGDTMTYRWSFGDGTSSTSAGATHAYSAAGTYTASFVVTDSKSAASTAVNRTITVTAPAATPPVATGDSYSVVAGKTLTVASPGVLGNDSSPSGKTLTTKLVSSVASGTLSLASNGSFTFKPASGFSGTRTFTYTATDGTSTSAAATVTITVTPAASTASGLVAAYGFNEGSGTTVTDSSGKGNTGSIANATWTTSGRFGRALSFNGSNSMVTVNDSASLDVTGAMTLEAWVYPQGSLSDWRTILMKEQAGSDVYYIETVGGQMVGDVYVGGSKHNTYSDTAIALNTWSHLAATYDGANLRIYINGTLAHAATSLTGNIQTSTGALRIGGNSIWGEYFQGLIDEVRIYNRALSSTEIATDMNTAVK
jgi:chitodextrinase